MESLSNRGVGSPGSASEKDRHPDVFFVWYQTPVEIYSYKSRIVWLLVGSVQNNEYPWQSLQGLFICVGAR